MNVQSNRKPLVTFTPLHYIGANLYNECLKNAPLSVKGNFARIFLHCSRFSATRLAKCANYNNIKTIFDILIHSGSILSKNIILTIIDSNTAKTLRCTRLCEL